MKRSTPLARVGRKRLAEQAEQGLRPLSTILARTREVRPKPQRRTGPAQSVRDIVRVRSGGWCEHWACGKRATEQHHRYERGSGGVGPKGPRWINVPSNLLDACHGHNQWASNGSPADAEAAGWIVRRRDPATVPVRTRHASEPILLNKDGGWSTEPPVMDGETA